MLEKLAPESTLIFDSISLSRRRGGGGRFGGGGLGGAPASAVMRRDRAVFSSNCHCCFRPNGVLRHRKRSPKACVRYCRRPDLLIRVQESRGVVAPAGMSSRESNKRVSIALLLFFGRRMLRAAIRLVGLYWASLVLDSRVCSWKQLLMPANAKANVN